VRDNDPKLPRNVPDMTLPSKGREQSSAAPLPATKLPEPSRQIHEIPAAEQSNVPAAHPWAKGDRVLAPWEPHFLYVGTIEQVQGNEASIEFDNGDTGWVPVISMEPLSVKVGDVVHCRKKLWSHFLLGTLEQIERDKILVRFFDGSKEWTILAAIRVACAESGPGVNPMHERSHLLFQKRLVAGDRVLALWQSEFAFSATVTECEPNRVQVEFDSGASRWVPLNQIAPILLAAGMQVRIRQEQDGYYDSAKILDVDGEEIQLEMVDGRQLWTQVSQLAIPWILLGPHASLGNHGRPALGGLPFDNLVWWIGIITILLAIARMGR
jgi:hypothetical protein